MTSKTRSSRNNIEMFLGTMILEEDFRQKYRKSILLNHIEDENLRKIAQELMEEDFDLKKILINNSKEILIRIIDISLKSFKHKKIHGEQF